MDLPRNTLQEFHFSSAIAASRQTILPIASVDSSFKRIRITDLKMTCGGTARTVKFYVASYSTYGKALEFDMPANSITNFAWEIPYVFSVVSSTLETRPLVSSASGTGVKFSISGYVEK